MNPLESAAPLEAPIAEDPIKAQNAQVLALLTRLFGAATFTDVEEPYGLLTARLAIPALRLSFSLERRAGEFDERGITIKLGLPEGRETGDIAGTNLSTDVCQPFAQVARPERFLRGRDLRDRLLSADIQVLTIGQLRDRALAIAGDAAVMNAPQEDARIVGVVEYRDGRSSCRRGCPIAPTRLRWPAQSP